MKIYVALLLFSSFAACQAPNKCVEKKAPEGCICTRQYDPVCGCNNKTYGNACMAECTGITKYTKGACTSETPATRQPTARLEGNKWIFLRFAGTNAQSLPEGITAFAQFEKGRVTGKSACNTFGGQYILDGDKITISKIFGTEMYCGEAKSSVEQRFLDCLHHTTRYAITGDVLTIFCADNSSLVFQQEKP